MPNEIETRLQSAPVVPLIQSDDPEIALQIARALLAGGLGVLEVVMRTPAALDCLAHIASELPGAITGAGTVLSAAHAEDAARAGARFLVSPGLDEGVVERAAQSKLPIFPGIATATEAQRAWNLGLRTVKFFPAGQAGGVPMIKALGSVFRDLRFMPTGGVSAKNLSEYLALPAVMACGGSWLTPASAIAAGDFDAITELAREAVTIAQRARA